MVKKRHNNLGESVFKPTHVSSTCQGLNPSCGVHTSLKQSPVFPGNGPHVSITTDGTLALELNINSN